VQDPDLDSLRLRNLLQGYHWLGLARQSCMTSGSATRWFRAWHSFPERELLPFRPLLQHRRLDGKPPVQGLLERDSRSGCRSSVHCSDDDGVMHQRLPSSDEAGRIPRRRDHRLLHGCKRNCLLWRRSGAAQSCGRSLVSGAQSLVLVHVACTPPQSGELSRADVADVKRQS